MYQVGDRLVYGVHGVCQVAREEQRRVDGKELTYLALEPVGQRGTCYLVPTQNPSAMRRLPRTCWAGCKAACACWAVSSRVRA